MRSRLFVHLFDKNEDYFAGQKVKGKRKNVKGKSQQEFFFLYSYINQPRMVRSRLEKNFFAVRSSRFDVNESCKWIDYKTWNWRSDSCENGLCLPLTSRAHWCWVMKPCDACKEVSSAPLNRKMTECLIAWDCFERTRSISNITTQLPASSLAPEDFKKFVFSLERCSFYI